MLLSSLIIALRAAILPLPPTHTPSAFVLYAILSAIPCLFLAIHSLPLSFLGLFIRPASFFSVFLRVGTAVLVKERS